MQEGLQVLRRVWADQTATFKLKNLQLINSIVDVANVSLDETAVTMEEEIQKR